MAAIMGYMSLWMVSEVRTVLSPDFLQPTGSYMLVSFLSRCCMLQQTPGVSLNEGCCSDCGR